MRTGRRNDCSMMSSRPRKRAPPPARNTPEITTTPAAMGDNCRRPSADIKQTASEVALVLGQTGFGGSERLEHRIADENARFIRGGNEILRRGNRGSDHGNVGDE